MKKINQPEDNVEAIIDTCLQTLDDRGEVTALATLKPHLIRQEAKYFAHGTQGTLHTLRERLTDAREKTFLKKLYNNKLLKGSCRSYYDRIKVLSPLRCPYCEVGRPETLDHFLPKSKFCSFAITPINLVPACFTCNAKYKKKFSGQAHSGVFVHPYFEDTERDIWLHATLDFEAGVVSFFADPGNQFSEDMRAKILNTFEKLSLRDRYSEEGNAKLENIKKLILEQFKNIPEDHVEERGLEISKLLQSQYLANCSESINRWDTALYRTISSSPEYWRGGYLKFGAR